MPTITLQILKEDIETADFTDSEDCALTRAFRRAGHADWYDLAGSVHQHKGGTVIGSDNEDYAVLYQKVAGMYKFVDPKGWDGEFVATQPIDFTHTINY